MHSIRAFVINYVRKWGRPEKDPPESTPSMGLAMVAVLAQQHDRLIVANFCRRYHCELFFADTCEEALILLDELEPQVILMDRDAGGGNWRATMSSLASAASGACIMLVSRVVDERLWNEVVRNGGYEVLPTPVQEDEVCRAVRLAWSYWSSAANSTAATRK
jgi:DNA-binding NarL/FixJ family response regulator